MMLSARAIYASLLALSTLLCATSINADTPRRPDVPYVQSPMESVYRMLEMGEVSRGDYVIDLGSGDGRIVISAVKDWGARKGLGVEIDPLLVQESRDNAQAAGVSDKVNFIEGDLFELDFSEASVLTMFLLQPLNIRLRPVILENMKPGSRVVSHVFHMEDWEPDLADERLKIYMWVVPANVGGNWRITLPESDTTITLSLAQTFQKIGGYAIVNGNWVPVTHARLRGAEIRFDIMGDSYIGLVEGNSIRALDQPGARPGWRAQRLRQQ